jgi:hypothetical protein
MNPDEPPINLDFSCDDGCTLVDCFWNCNEREAAGLSHPPILSKSKFFVEAAVVLTTTARKRFVCPHTKPEAEARFP